jgi:hypothetical protein
VLTTDHKSLRNIKPNQTKAHLPVVHVLLPPVVLLPHTIKASGALVALKGGVLAVARPIL